MVLRRSQHDHQKLWNVQAIPQVSSISAIQRKSGMRVASHVPPSTSMETAEKQTPHTPACTHSFQIEKKVRQIVSRHTSWIIRSVRKPLKKQWREAERKESHGVAHTHKHNAQKVLCNRHVLRFSVTKAIPDEMSKAKSSIRFSTRPLKRPQLIETRAFPGIVYALITANTQLLIHFVQ